MKILSLDQALGVTGWAFFEDNKLIKSGTFSISKTKSIEERLWDFISQIENLIEFYEIEHVAFEDIQNQHNNETYKRLAYVQAAVIIICKKHSLSFSILGPSHWRSLLNIKGRKREEQKKAAIIYVKDNCGKEVSSDEADAVCIGMACLKEIGKNQSAF